MKEGVHEIFNTPLSLQMIQAQAMDEVEIPASSSSDSMEIADLLKVCVAETHTDGSVSSYEQ